MHVAEAGSEEEGRTLAVRDHLRANGVAARECEALKRRLAVEFDGEDFASREGYAIAKSAFILRIDALTRVHRSRVESRRRP